MTVSIHNMISNTLLSVLKLMVGWIAHSQAILSDGIHSAADVFETVIVIIGVKLSAKPADEEHPYGHERFECVAALILSTILGLTGAGIGIGGIGKILGKDYGSLAVPGIIAVFVAIFSILVKEAMYWYTRINAKRIGSTALMADAWHHRLDALCSAGSLIGVVGARLGAPICDPLLSVIICIFIIRAAIEIFKDAVGKMVDKSCSKEVVEQIRETVSKQQGVMGVDKIRTRLFGMKIFVEVEIMADGNCTLYETHGIAETVHHAIEQEIPEVKHCMVHVNPYYRREGVETTWIK
ncbi:MAG: cation diffusion facilitator family transporter [Lachnospiraceae bacterium]